MAEWILGHCTYAIANKTETAGALGSLPTLKFKLSHPQSLRCKSFGLFMSCPPFSQYLCKASGSQHVDSVPVMSVSPGYLTERQKNRLCFNNQLWGDPAPRGVLICVCMCMCMYVVCVYAWVCTWALIFLCNPPLYSLKQYLSQNLKLAFLTRSNGGRRPESACFCWGHRHTWPWFHSVLSH